MASVTSLGSSERSQVPEPSPSKKIDSFPPLPSTPLHPRIVKYATAPHIVRRVVRPDWTLDFLLVSGRSCNTNLSVETEGRLQELHLLPVRTSTAGAI